MTTGTSRAVSYVSSEKLVSAADALPSNEGRASLVDALVQSLDLLQLPGNEAEAETPNADGKAEPTRARLVEPEPATRAQLLAFHDANFIDTLLGLKDMGDESSSSSGSESSNSSSSPAHDRARKRPRVAKTHGLEDDCPAFPAMAEYCKQVAGASIEAARQVRDEKALVAIAWTGGRHHAKRGEAAGFCYIQDVVLAILELRKPPPRLRRNGSDAAADSPSSRIKRVLYLDIDLHHGDGVEAAFYSTQDVLTLSIHLHAAGFFPATGALDSTGPSTNAAYHALNLALEPGLSSSSLLRVFTSCVEPVFKAFSPDAVVLQCGCDGLAGDPCSEWNIDLEGFGRIVQGVLNWGVKTLLLGGGGYNNANAARCWSFLTAIALGRTLNLNTVIPPSIEEYASFSPSWTLDVPAGNRAEHNSEDSLGQVEAAFQGYAAKLEEMYRL